MILYGDRYDDILNVSLFLHLLHASRSGSIKEKGLKNPNKK